MLPQSDGSRLSGLPLRSQILSPNFHRALRRTARHEQRPWPDTSGPSGRLRQIPGRWWNAAVVGAIVVVLCASFPSGLPLDMASGHGDFQSSAVGTTVESVPVNGTPDLCGLTVARSADCLPGSNLAVDPNWLNLTQYYSTAPLPRFDAASTYDAGDGYALVFGGRTANQAWNDTWSFSNGSWTDRSPFLATSSNNPSARYGASMAYDAATGFVVLFGGRNLTT